VEMVHELIQKIHTPLELTSDTAFDYLELCRNPYQATGMQLELILAYWDIECRFERN
jgi:hypothetical protein